MTAIAEARVTASLTPREHAIVRLLEQLPDLHEPFADGRAAGSGTHVPLMPHEPSCQLLGERPLRDVRGRPICTCARRSVVELERLLAVMREDRHRALLTLEETGERVSVRACWWHVNAWWVTARFVMFEPALQVGRRRQPVKLAVDDFGRVLPQRRAVREAGARHDVALRGVSWLGVEWGIDQVPSLPVVRDAA